MKTVINQRFKPRTHASPVVLLGQVHPEASVALITEESPETSEVSVQLKGQVQELVREFLLSGATGSNGPPDQWSKEFQPLELVTRPTVPTDQAAYYLNRKPQTLRNWASRQEGPINPIRISGRLAWPISSLRKVLSGGNQ